MPPKKKNTKKKKNKSKKEEITTTAHAPSGDEVDAPLEDVALNGPAIPRNGHHLCSTCTVPLVTECLQKAQLHDHATSHNEAQSTTTSSSQPSSVNKNTKVHPENRMEIAATQISNTIGYLKTQFRGNRTSLHYFNPTDESQNIPESVKWLSNLTGKQIAVWMTDGRLMVGEFACVDHAKNIVMAAAYQYKPSTVKKGTYDKRFNSDIIIPGKYVVKVQLANNNEDLPSNKPISQNE